MCSCSRCSPGEWQGGVTSSPVTWAESREQKKVGAVLPERCLDAVILSILPTWSILLSGRTVRGVPPYDISCRLKEGAGTDELGKDAEYWQRGIMRYANFFSNCWYSSVLWREAEKPEYVAWLCPTV